MTLRAEHGQKVCENSLLRGAFGPKMNEATEGCRRMLNEGLCNLHPSPIVIRLMK
jgi:hypothetical protein